MMLAADRPVPLHGNGNNARNYIFVTDVARALIAIMHRGKQGQVCVRVVGVGGEGACWAASRECA
jgi:dTDP-D-glucose 4,6-dehydratase